MSEGDYFIDDYKLINCVATGTYSQVWEVSEKGGGQSLAMKLLQREAFEGREQIGVLKHEAKVGKSLDHPNLIRCQKCVVTKKHAYMLMDYFRSQNIKAQIGSDLTPLHARLRKLVEGVVLGMEYMHEQGWVHKDLKPDNVLFNKSSEVRIIDFSLAARIGALAKMVAGSRKRRVIQGTRTYIAPETIRRELPEPHTDIYSLGVTLFEVLTGVPPFRGSSPDDLLKRHLTESPPNPSDLHPNVTPEMDRFVLRMLAKKPKNRHKDMREVFSEFRALKPFQEDPEEWAERKKEEARQKQLDSLDQAHRLDSRTDALKKELGRTDDSGSSGKSSPRKPSRKPSRPKAPQQPQQQPAATQQPGYYGPPPAGTPYGAPPYYPPGYPYPHPPYGAPVPPGAAPGPPEGAQPGMPPNAGWYWPGGAPAPGQQPVPGQQPAPQQPPPGATPQQQPSPQAQQPPPQQAETESPEPASTEPSQPSPQPPSSAQRAEEPPAQTPDEQKKQGRDDDDLPFMDELPEVI